MRIEITGRDIEHRTHELRAYALEGAAEAPLDMRWVRKLRIDVDCRDVWPTCRATAWLRGGGELWTLGRARDTREAVVRAVSQFDTNASLWKRVLASAGTLALTVAAVAAVVALLR